MNDHEEVEEGEPTRRSLEAQYMYTTQSRAAGPCTLPQLQVLWRSGHIYRTTSVWREGLSSWLEIQAFPEVADALLALPQPPAVAEAETLWYYLDASSGQQRGGLTALQIGSLLSSGDIDGLTHVWRKGMPAWLELGQIPELKQQLQQIAEADDDEAFEQPATELAAYDPAYKFDTEALAEKKAAAAAAAVAAAAGASAGAPVAEAAAPAAAKPKRVRKKKKKFVDGGGTNVYVSGLPLDMTLDEIVECFKVAGMLKNDHDGKPKIKLYLDRSGMPKGDALLSFMKAESVALAQTLRDGYNLREGHVLTVQPAKFEQRGDLVVKKAGKEEVELRKKQKVLERRKLAEWDDGLLPSGLAAASVVILQALFNPEEVPAEDAVDFYSNLKQDLTIECAKANDKSGDQAGELDKVTIFEGSEAGAAAVKFKGAEAPEAAQRCVAMMNARSFGGALIKAELYDGVSDYRAKAVREASSGGAAGSVRGGALESVEEQEEKLESFAQWLEADSTDEEPDPNADD